MEDKINKSLQTQLDKYSPPDATPEEKQANLNKEMARRRSLVKKPGFASMDPEKRRLAAQKGGINSGINYRKNKDAENKETEDSRQSS